MKSLRRLLLVGIGACCAGLMAGFVISQSSSTGSQAVAQSDGSPGFTPEEQRIIDEAGPPLAVDNRLAPVKSDSPLLGLCQQHLKYNEKVDDASYADDAYACEVLSLLAQDKLKPGDYTDAELAKAVEDAGGDPPPPDVVSSSGGQR